MESFSCWLPAWRGLDLSSRCRLLLATADLGGASMLTQLSWQYQDRFSATLWTSSFFMCCIPFCGVVSLSLPVHQHRHPSHSRHDPGTSQTSKFSLLCVDSFALSRWNRLFPRLYHFSLALNESPQSFIFVDSTISIASSTSCVDLACDLAIQPYFGLLNYSTHWIKNIMSHITLFLRLDSWHLRDHRSFTSRRQVGCTLRSWLIIAVFKDENTLNEKFKFIVHLISECMVIQGPPLLHQSRLALFGRLTHRLMSTNIDSVAIRASSNTGSCMHVARKVLKRFLFFVWFNEYSFKLNQSSNVIDGHVGCCTSLIQQGTFTPSDRRYHMKFIFLSFSIDCAGIYSTVYARSTAVNMVWLFIAIPWEWSTWTSGRIFALTISLPRKTDTNACLNHMLKWMRNVTVSSVFKAEAASTRDVCPRLHQQLLLVSSW